MSDVDERTIESEQERLDSEQDDANGLVRLVQAYCAKHPESTVVFGVRVSISDKMRITDMGDPKTRASMGYQVHTRAVAAIKQMERSRIVAPSSVSEEAAKTFLEQVRRGRGMQGG
jgi:hypothetical protein